MLLHQRPSGRTIGEVERGLDDHTVTVAGLFGGPLSAGLWLSRSVVDELLASPDALARSGAGLSRRGLSCHTLNAFPYGDFHDTRVKEAVYRPDWTTPDRLDYTLGCRRILAAILPEGREGTISTLPLGFKPFHHPDDVVDRCAAQLLEAARQLNELHDETGRMIRLAVEPEPFCLVETTDEAIAFFERLRNIARKSDEVDFARRHLGLCYDVCHQAVEFEDVARSIESLERADVRINKVHISCAIEVSQPGRNAEARERSCGISSRCHLHQTMAKSASRGAAGSRFEGRAVQSPAAEFLEADCWRVHFHVPVDAESLGPLGTTRHELKKARGAVGRLPLTRRTWRWRLTPGPCCRGMRRSVWRKGWQASWARRSGCLRGRPQRFDSRRARRPDHALAAACFEDALQMAVNWAMRCSRSIGLAA